MHKPNRITFRLAEVSFLAVAFLLLALPVNTLAQDPSRDYGSVVQNPLQRTLDAYGKGPFCAGCHNIPYPLPPEMPARPSTYPVGAYGGEPGLKRLTESLGRDVGAVYSPEENKIAWVTDSLGNWTVWVMDDDGTGKQQLTPSSVISGWPSWSPDGQEIAYWSYNLTSKTCDIWKVKIDGSSRVRLTADGSFKGPPMWSPRGDRVAYTANQTGNMEAYIINTDGTGTKQLTTGHNPGYWVESRTTWHPDGVRLYYQVTTFPLPPLTVPEITGDVAFVEIFSLNVDTGLELNLTPKLHENVRSVSSDGRMAYISLRSPNYGLWIMNEDGTGQTRLTWNGKGDRAPRITPDGKRIVYWSLASGNPDIWLINSDGTNNTQLTNSPYMDVYPSWSPDGRKVAFESDRAGSFDIWALSLDQPLKVNVEFETCATKGDNTKAFLTVRPSDGRGAIRLESLELRFDWDEVDNYVNPSNPLPTTISSPNDPLRIPIEFKVPANAGSGYHFYDIKIQYLATDTSGSDSRMTYEQTSGDLEVGIPEHTKSDRLFVELGGRLERLHGKAINESAKLGMTTSEVALPLKGYFDYLLKPEAKPFLEANHEFYEATRLYLAGDYPQALSRFQNVKALVSEQSMNEARGQTFFENQTLLALLPIVLVVALLVVHIKRKNRQNNDD